MFHRHTSVQADSKQSPVSGFPAFCCFPCFVLLCFALFCFVLLCFAVSWLFLGLVEGQLTQTGTLLALAICSRDRLGKCEGHVLGTQCSNGNSIDIWIHDSDAGAVLNTTRVLQVISLLSVMTTHIKCGLTSQVGCGCGTEKPACCFLTADCYASIHDRLQTIGHAVYIADCYFAGQGQR